MGDQIHLEKMGRELKCPICLSLLDSSVSLTCNHVFCNSCIMKSMKSGSNCPVCKVPFQRREVRAAPHMDSLVNIYKGMEAASGFQIFLTQNPSSAKMPEESKQANGKICAREDTDRICKNRSKNQRLSRRKGPRNTIKSSNAVSGSNAAKPAFPTKKRVQVPQCLLSETPNRSEKLESRSSENIEDGFKDTSLVPKENSVLDRKAEHGLSPFFWLRDDEDSQRLSQQGDGSQPLEVSPPYVPTFSDIKDSDDGSPSNLSLNEQTGEKSSDVQFLDSEMFEWTQRPCSPELFSSPAKTMQESKETPRQFLNKSDLSNEKEKFMSAEDIKEKELHPTSCTIASGRRSANIKSNKRGKTNTRVTLKRCLKKDAGQDSSLSLKKKSRKGLQEKAHYSPGISVNNKENISVGPGTESRFESVHPISLTVEIPKFKDTVDTELPAPLGKKRRGSEDTGDRINSTIAENAGPCTNLQTDCPVSLKKQKLNYMDNSIMEENDENQKGEEVGGKKISNIKQKRLKQRKEIRPALRSKSNKNSVCKKNAKVSFQGTSEDELIDAEKEIHSNLSAKESKFTSKVLNVPEIETKLTSLSENSFGSKVGGSSVMSVQVDQSEEAALRAFQTVNQMIQCAFCHSSEDTKASGEMVHYFNGRPVPANYSGGLEVIHAHKNCAEWAPNVYFEDDIAINLKAELARSKKIVCCCCGLKGAALGCYERSCRKSFHVTCAKMTPQCRWDTDNFVMLCPLHASCKLPNEGSDSLERKRKCIPKEKRTQQSYQVVSKHDSSAYPVWNLREKLDKLVLCCSALTVEERELVSQFQKFSGIKVMKNYDLSVTHVIASVDENGACRRTLKFLMGILEGKWILNIEWVKACMKATKLVQEEQYEIKVDIHGTKNGPQLGRLRISNKQPKLFEGLKFYLMRDFPDSYKGYIHDIIVAGGGSILHRKPIYSVEVASTFIIYSLELSDKCDLNKKDTILNQRRFDAKALADATGAKAVSNSWVLNSVAACKLLTSAE